ncbi:MAG: hypothetical protein ABIR47_07990 [Candidatus Kapaibacterium sp.]
MKHPGILFIGLGLLLVSIPAYAQNDLYYWEDIGYPFDQYAVNERGAIQSIASSYISWRTPVNYIIKPRDLRVFDQDGALVCRFHIAVSDRHFYARMLNRAHQVSSIKELIVTGIPGQTKGSIDSERVELVQYDLRYDNKGRILAIGTGSKYGYCWQRHFKYNARGQRDSVVTTGENMADGTHLCTLTESYSYQKNGGSSLVRELRWRDSIIKLRTYKYDKRGFLIYRSNQEKLIGSKDYMDDTQFTFINDQFGNPIKSIQHDRYGEYHMDYVYQYDEQGNWIAFTKYYKPWENSKDLNNIMKNQVDSFSLQRNIFYYSNPDRRRGNIK